MSKEHYDAMVSVILSLPDTESKSPNMPIDKFIQEAADLEIWSAIDLPKLLAVGVPQETFDNLPILTGSLRYAQSQWNKDRFTKEEARKEWNEKQPAAMDHKDELEHSFRFAFRKVPELLTKVKYIEEGSGHADLVQDLSDLSVLGKDNTSMLEAIGFDMNKLDIAENLSIEMSELLATMNGSIGDKNATRVIRDKAYTLLKRSVDEIREAGRFVFWKDKDKLKGYRSQYRSQWK
ncbi:hypothetical protein [Reichenbachiella versicolor]|uniref:hypothetical protein n=1 Tax=Reichenbachiella versicolor TaxID=1821036 RepID=UPI000D6E97A6|nr:hypothetical protein [Reichenbachiella versicolor]